jgi:flagellar hook assembly protein FlgD
MVPSLNHLGSMVIDIDGDRLDARFLDDNGSVLDVFTIRKGVAIGAPVPATSLRLRVESENPFRSTMRFRIDAPAPGTITLSLYDVRGRHVKTITSRRRAAGLHYETWDGRNSRGGEVAPGVYFAVLNHSGDVRVQKVVRIR